MAQPSPPGAGLAAQLAQGLTLQTGAFRFRIESRQPSVARGLALLYEDFPIGPDEGLRDFHIRIDAVPGPRRWLGRQINFWRDGFSPFKPLPRDHAFALTEWGMNWCLAGHAHHYLMLHAAVLERNGACIVMPGLPGAGKSTLTAALMLSGWRLLSDELAMIDRDDGGLMALARPVSLKNESIEIIRRFDASAVFGEPAYDTHKGTVSHLRPTRSSVLRALDKGRAAHLIFPRWRADAPTELRARPKADSFELLARNAFNYSLLGRLGFEMSARLIEGCDCWDFSYSKLDEALRCFEGLCP